MTSYTVFHVVCWKDPYWQRKLSKGNVSHFNTQLCIPTDLKLNIWISCQCCKLDLRVEYKKTCSYFRFLLSGDGTLVGLQACFAKALKQRHLHLPITSKLRVILCHFVSRNGTRSPGKYFRMNACHYKTQTCVSFRHMSHKFSRLYAKLTILTHFLEILTLNATCVFPTHFILAHSRSHFHWHED